MADMKPCFGKELALRFGPGMMPIGADPEAARKECHECEDLERCAIVVALTFQLRSQRREEKKGQ